MVPHACFEKTCLLSKICFLWTKVDCVFPQQIQVAIEHLHSYRDLSETFKAAIFVTGVKKEKSDKQDKPSVEFDYVVLFLLLWIFSRQMKKIVWMMNVCQHNQGPLLCLCSLTLTWLSSSSPVPYRKGITDIDIEFAFIWMMLMLCAGKAPCLGHSARRWHFLPHL